MKNFFFTNTFLAMYCFICRGRLPKPVPYFTYPTTDKPTITSEKTQETRFAYPISGNLEVITLSYLIFHSSIFSY